MLDKCMRADNFWKRFRGLMFKRKLAPGEGLLLEDCNSIHMFFMCFSIDAIFLDEENVVVKVVENLRPWRDIVLPQKGAKKVLEVESGFIRKHQIVEGGNLVFS